VGGNNVKVAGEGVAKCWFSFILKRLNKKGQFMRYYKEESFVCMQLNKRGNPSLTTCF